MTRAQLIALLAAVGGAGFGAGSAFDYRAGPPASITYPHALRIEARQLSDGGLAGDVITVYRTRATEEPDGGLDLEDVGPASCVGDTAPVRLFARNNCKRADGGLNTGVYVLEFRPFLNSDGGAGVALEAYGDEAVRCVVPKTAAFRTSMADLTCTTGKRRSGAQPL